MEIIREGKENRVICTNCCTEYEFNVDDIFTYGEAYYVKCPVCGAALDIEEDRDQALCAYCGTKVLLHNENEYIYRHVDEAEIKQAETDRMVRMKQLEYEERERIDSKKSKEQRNKVLLSLSHAGNSSAYAGNSVNDVVRYSDEI